MQAQQPKTQKQSMARLGSTGRMTRIQLLHLKAPDGSNLALSRKSNKFLKRCTAQTTDNC